MTTSSAGSMSGGKIIRRIVLGTILLIAFICLGLFGYYRAYVNTPGPIPDGIGGGDQNTVVVTIPKGSSVKKIGEILGEQQVIVDDIRFLILAKISGYSTKLQAGEFLLPRGKKPQAILELLASAKPYSYSVTIPEGLTAKEIAAIFAKDGWCEEGRFLELVSDSKTITKFGLTRGTSLEGFLYPDTYHFTREVAGAEMVIDILLERFAEVWMEEIKGLEPIPDVDDTVILASIVEKETAAPHERPLIAGVFHNRLKRGMRLQSDPTVVYGVTDYDGVITKKHLRTPTPYNTYTIPGLPVGPIANPGREAINAVLHPEVSKNLYFVSKNDGTHKFSTNLKDHNRAVQKYQRKKKVKKGK